MEYLCLALKMFFGMVYIIDKNYDVEPISEPIEEAAFSNLDKLNTPDPDEKYRNVKVSDYIHKTLGWHIVDERVCTDYYEPF